MSDHANIVRKWMRFNLYQLDEELGSSVPTTAKFNDALAALDALVAERDEEERRAIENGRMAQSNWDRAESAEARCQRLSDHGAEWEKRGRAAEYNFGVELDARKDVEAELAAWKETNRVICSERDAAEAEVARLREWMGEAIEEMGKATSLTERCDYGAMRSLLARAALPAAKEEDV